MTATRNLIVIGGGEHARVIIEAARSQSDGWNVLGFVDPAPCLETCQRLNVRRLGSDEDSQALIESGCFVLGMSRFDLCSIRRRIVHRYEALGARWATVIHARAWVSPTAKVGPGTVVFAGAVINSGAEIGVHGVVNTGAILEHDVKVGDHSQVAPGAVLGGGAVVGRESYIGLGSRVRDHVRIGDRVVVGMGAAVVQDIPDDKIVVGVPAKPMHK